MSSTNLKGSPFFTCSIPPNLESIGMPCFKRTPLIRILQTVANPIFPSGTTNFSQLFSGRGNGNKFGYGNFFLENRFHDRQSFAELLLREKRNVDRYQTAAFFDVKSCFKRENINAGNRKADFIPDAGVVDFIQPQSW